MNKSLSSLLRWKFILAILILYNVINEVLSLKMEPIKFAGYEWDYKVGNARGPGPNIFKRENIYVDSEDRLHLNIRKEQNNWTCAEIYSRKTGFGYGLYSWTLETDITKFDPSVVVGLYTWDNFDNSNYNREIDIEFSKWNIEKDKTNAQFVVQPYYYRTNIVRFTQPSTNISIHSFLWTKDNVKFRSYDLSGNILNWDYNKPKEKKKVFTPSPGLSIRMNLWLFKHVAPKSSKNHQIIISDFSFTPINNLEGIYFD